MNPLIVDVATGFPPHYYDQETITSLLREYFWAGKRQNVERLERFHERVQVKGRHLALPLEAYATLAGFGQSNDAWIEVALDVASETICRLLAQTGLEAGAITQLTTTTVTGVAVPTLGARLMNRIAFRPDLKRVPLFGLGCLGGAAGIARVADYLRGHPAEAALFLAVELCSLTLQPADLSIANIISTGLFGDGAAAVLLVGGEHPLARMGLPRIVDSRSAFFADTEEVMGWEVTDSGFQVVLNAAVPEIAEERLPPVVDAFLAEHGLVRRDIAVWISHPGGPAVIDALETGLSLEPGTLDLSRESLAEVGNVSSASVLFILQETLRRADPPAGSFGVLLAMGPAFCAELVLLQW